MYYRWKTRKFPIWYDPDKNTWYGETALSYPREPTIISSEHTAMALIGIPIAVFLLMQARVRSFWDLNHAIWGHIKAVAVMTLLEESFKRYVTRPRPYFMTACQPKDPDQGVGSPNRPVWATTQEACTNALDPDALQSFPSGHAGNSFAAAMFLTLYLNAKLKAFSNYYTYFWKQMIVLLPLIAAGIVAASMVIDRNHHVTDVFTGILLGCLCGLLAYRAQYHSIFDYRNNHIPLPYRAFYPRFLAHRFGPKQTYQETQYGTTLATEEERRNAVPDKYLAVRWPFNDNLKRGPIETKKFPPPEAPALEPKQSDMRARSPYMGSRQAGMDGNPSTNALWSNSQVSHAEENAASGSTVLRSPKATRSPSATDEGTVTAESGSARNREYLAPISESSGATGTESPSGRDRDRDYLAPIAEADGANMV